MLNRLWTLVMKELQLLLREPQTRAILIVPVVIQVLLFPYAATLNVTHASVSVYNEDGGKYSIELMQRLAHAKTVENIHWLSSQHQITEEIDQHKALVVVHIPADFSKKISQFKPGGLQLLLDGRNSNSAQILASYISTIAQQYQLELLSGHSTAIQSKVIVRNWYNPNLDYKWFVLPSLVALITTAGVMIVTSLSVAREREQGTLDQLLVSPLTTWQIFVGKAVPAIIVAMFQASVVLLFAIFAFRVPFSGTWSSLMLFYLSMLIYGLSLVGIGLVISSMCYTQQQAFIGVFVFIMPAILLSGYVSPVENMPEWLQTATWLNPIRHFTAITKEIYLKNADFSVVWQGLWPMLIITALTTSWAYIMFRRKVS